MTHISKLFPVVILYYILTVMKGNDYETYEYNIPKMVGFLLNPLHPRRLSLTMVVMHLSNLLSFCIGVIIYVIFDEFVFGKWYLGSLIIFNLTIILVSWISSILSRDTKYELDDDQSVREEVADAPKEKTGTDSAWDDPILKSQDGEENRLIHGDVIRFPNSYFWNAIARVIFFNWMLIIVFRHPEKPEWWLYAGFISFWLIGVVNLMGVVNEFMIVEQDHFLYRSMFRKTYAFFYSEVIDCRIGPYGVMIRTKERKIHLNPDLPGVLELADRLRNQTSKR